MSPELVFDPELFAIGGVSLIILVFGLTQFIKELAGWDGKKVTALAAGLGFVIMVVFQALAYIPAPYDAIVTGLVVSIAFGLSASGYYKFAARNS